MYRDLACSKEKACNLGSYRQFERRGDNDRGIRVRIKSCGLAALAFLSSTSAHAGFICIADAATQLGVDAGGSVVVQLEGIGPLNICSVTPSGDTEVSADACRTWYASLLSYRLANKKTRLYFSNDYASNAGLTACSQLGAWSHHSPYFLEGL